MQFRLITGKEGDEDAEYIPESDFKSEWFVKCHRRIINNIQIFSIKERKDDPSCPEHTFFLTSSDDCNVYLHNFDGIFIGQFGQDVWNIYSVNKLLRSKKRRDVDLDRINMPKWAGEVSPQRFGDDAMQMREELEDPGYNYGFKEEHGGITIEDAG